MSHVVDRNELVTIEERLKEQFSRDETFSTTNPYLKTARRLMNIVGVGAALVTLYIAMVAALWTPEFEPQLSSLHRALLDGGMDAADARRELDSKGTRYSAEMFLVMFVLGVVALLMQVEWVWRKLSKCCCPSVRGPPEKEVHSVAQKELIPVGRMTPAEMLSLVKRRARYRKAKGIYILDEGVKDGDLQRALACPNARNKNPMIEAKYHVNYNTCFVRNQMIRQVTIVGMDDATEGHYLIKEEWVTFPQLLYLRRGHLGIELITEVTDIFTDFIWFLELWKDPYLTDDQKWIQWMVIFAGLFGLLMYLIKIPLMLTHYRNQYVNGEFHLALYSIALGICEDIPQIVCMIMLGRWYSLTTIMKLCLSVFMLCIKVLTPFLYQPDLCCCKYICGAGAKALFNPVTDYKELYKINDKLMRERKAKEEKKMRKRQDALFRGGAAVPNVQNAVQNPGEQDEPSVSENDFTVTVTVLEPAESKDGGETEGPEVVTVQAPDTDGKESAAEKGQAGEEAGQAGVSQNFSETPIEQWTTSVFLAWLKFIGFSKYADHIRAAFTALRRAIRETNGANLSSESTATTLMEIYNEDLAEGNAESGEAGAQKEEMPLADAKTIIERLRELYMQTDETLAQSTNTGTPKGPTTPMDPPTPTQEHQMTLEPTTEDPLTNNTSIFQRAFQLVTGTGGTSKS